MTDQGFRRRQRLSGCPGVAQRSAVTASKNASIVDSSLYTDTTMSRLCVMVCSHVVERVRVASSNHADVSRLGIPMV